MNSIQQSFSNFPTNLVKSQQNEIRSSIGSVPESAVTSQGLNVNPSNPYINLIEQQKMILNHFTQIPRQLLNHETFQQLQQQPQQNPFTRPFIKHSNPHMAVAASVRMNSFRQELLRQKLAMSSQSNTANIVTGNSGTKSTSLPGPHFSFSPAEIQAQLKLRASSISSSSASSHDHSPSPPVENNFRHHPYFNPNSNHNFHSKPMKMCSSISQQSSVVPKNKLSKPKFDFDLKIKKEFNESPTPSVNKNVQDNTSTSKKNSGTIWSPIDLPDRKNFYNDKNEYKNSKNFQSEKNKLKNKSQYEEQKASNKDENTTKVHSNDNKVVDKSIKNDSLVANDTRSNFTGIPVGLQSLIEEYQRGLRDQATANQVANQFQALQQSLKTLISLQQQMNSTSAYNGNHRMPELNTFINDEKTQENEEKSNKMSSESDCEKRKVSIGGLNYVFFLIEKFKKYC